MDVLSTSTRFCSNVLLVSVFILISIATLPVMIIIAILRETEACVYRILYDARQCSPADILWRIIKKENPGDINSCIIVDGELSIERFIKRIDVSLLKAKNDNGENIYWQVTKYVVPGYINYYWIEEDNFDLHEHVYQLTTEPITSEKGLKEILRKGSTHEKPKKSPWEFILIPYLENGNRKTVIHFRIAHALSDGASLSYFLLLRLAESEHSIDQSQIRMPRYLQLKRWVLYLKALWTFPLTLKNLSTKKESNDFDNVLLTGDKHRCWSKPLDIKSIKDTKNKLGTTVNDVILGCCAKSFNDLFYEFNKYCPKQLSVTIPFNMRFNIDEAKEFKNKVTALIIKLPTYQADLKSCINEVNRNMDEVKLTCQPFAGYMSWKSITYCLIPDAFSHRFAMSCIENSVSLVASCVVGPQQKIRISGHPVDSIVYWAPSVLTVPASISFFSYNDELRIGIQTDSALFVNADKLVEIFERNFNSLGNI